MTPEEIQQSLDSLAPWFHCIDLGGGVRTKTQSAGSEAVDHPAETWDKIRRGLPTDLSGKSVLDVGCNAGFYAIEAKRRNAARVLGVDAQRHHVRQALFVRRVLDLDIEYRRMSVYDLNRCSVGQFDITLALGLIYHCKHLVYALERLFEVTKELLILETAILPIEKAPESFVDFAAADVLDLKRDRAILLCRKTKSALEGLILSQLKARLTLQEGPELCAAESELRFRVLVENTGNARWATQTEAGERGIVRLGAHLLLENGEEVKWDYGRASLDGVLEPDEETSLWLELKAPVSPGRYIIEFDLVLEHITWFEDLGTATIRHLLEVRI